MRTALSGFVGPVGVCCLVLSFVSVAIAEDTSLDRDEVAAIKKKLVTVQQAMGGDPDGYVKESEDFNLPTDFNPAKAGKFWPITSSISLRYTDRASKEGAANAKKTAEEIQAKYLAAVASGDDEAMGKVMEEMMTMNQVAAEAAINPQKKEPMTVYVQFNMNPYAGIDPDAVVFERPGVIALRDTNVSDDKGRVLVYLDPVALKETKKLSKVELRTPDDGVSKRAGVFNVTVQLDGTVADIEAWAQEFDTAAMLAVVDGQ